MDELLYQTRSSRPTVLWRPGGGRRIDLGLDSYRPFHRIVRTVHLQDAVHICEAHAMSPRPVTSLNSLSRRSLRRGHPLRGLQVLWFGTRHEERDANEAHDWYGNVEFSLAADVLLAHWGFAYLVELMTSPTQTVTRLLISNRDYTRFLPVYDPYCVGGGWYISPEGEHLELANCSRFNGEDPRLNRHGHTLEFMIEVTPWHQGNLLLSECQISFRNHEDARLMHRKHVCHRFQQQNLLCPTPWSTKETSRIFFELHHRLSQSRPMATPPLSPQAELHLQRFSREHELALAPLPPPPPPIYVPIPGVFSGGVPFPLINFRAYDRLLREIISDQPWVQPFPSAESSEAEDNSGVVSLQRPGFQVDPFPGVFFYQQHMIGGVSLPSNGQAPPGFLMALYRASLEVRLQLPGYSAAAEVSGFPASPRNL